MGNSNFPFESFPLVTIEPTEDTMFVSPEAIPSSPVQATKNEAIAKLTLNCDAHVVVWSGIKIERIGPGSDSDVDCVKVWYYLSGSVDIDGSPVVDIEKGDTL